MNGELVAAGSVALVVVAAAAYHYFTGRAVSVDLDEDGEDDISFEENEAGEEETLEEVAVEAAPQAVQEIGGELVEITGIGPSKAEQISRQGYHTAQDLYFATDGELLDLDGVGPDTLQNIRNELGSGNE